MGIVLPGTKTGAEVPLTAAPVAGMEPGARLGVRGVPVFRASALAVPNPGGIRAAFLLTSSFFLAPPSAVATGSKEVGVP